MNILRETLSFSCSFVGRKPFALFINMHRAFTKAINNLKFMKAKVSSITTFHIPQAVCMKITRNSHFISQPHPKLFQLQVVHFKDFLIFINMPQFHPSAFVAVTAYAAVLIRLLFLFKLLQLLELFLCQVAHISLMNRTPY